MPATYEPIATTTLGSAASSITFSSIPGTYTDLRLVLVGTQTSGSGVYANFNNDTGSNYSRTRLTGDGSSATSARNTNQTYAYCGYTSTNPTLCILDIFSYAGSTNKTCLSELNNDQNGSGFLIRQVILWRDTSAITEIDLTCDSTFATGYTATLYGILRA